MVKRAQFRRLGQVVAVICLTAILLIWGWFSYCPAPDYQLTDRQNIPIYVTSHSWHTAISWAQASALRQDMGAEARRDAPYVEFGWGDRQFFFAGDESLFSILRMALIPSDSVIHVASLPTSPDRFFSTEVQKLYLDAQGFQRLQTYIENTFYRAQGQRQMLGEGQYGDFAPSNFYTAVPKYSLWFNCNTWTAEALWHSGMAICPRRTLLAQQVMAQIKQWLTKS